MCDYSLQGLPNRIAKKDEELVIHRFSTGTLGFTSMVDMRANSGAQSVQKRSGFWSAIRDWFRLETGPPTPAICVPPGARLMLQEIPKGLQRDFGVGPNEEVTFTQLTAQPYNYRDAVRFNNGCEVLLQKLDTGQRAVVLCLSLVEEVAEAEVAEAEVAFAALR
ncbi:MAG: hypothetical protein L0220_13245 [Acidobacteria bacterium]|nr:hypothetical protein [Acidobacteriota bacterium]